MGGDDPGPGPGSLEGPPASPSARLPTWPCMQGVASGTPAIGALRERGALCVCGGGSGDQVYVVLCVVYVVCCRSKPGVVSCCEEL